MQYNHFEVHTRKRTVVLHLLFGLVFLAFGVLLVLPVLAGDMEADDMIIGAVALSFGIGFTFRGILLLFWKCTIQGNSINFRSLFRHKTITFFDIKRVAPMGQGNRNHKGVNSSFIGINLYSETGKLFHIHGSKEGFRAFVTRLEEQKVPGAEDLPKGIRWR